MPRKKWSPQDLSNEFWTVIEQTRGKRDALQAVLAKMDKSDFAEFYRECEEARTALTGPRFYRPGMSDDDVDDLADWIVAQGRQYFVDAYEHPERLPDSHSRKTGPDSVRSRTASSSSGSAPICTSCSMVDEQ